MTVARLKSSESCAPVDASTLYRHPVFSRGDLETSQSHMRSVITDAKIRSNALRVDAALFAVRTGCLRFLLLRYGAEVEVTPNTFDDFTLVQIPLSGVTEIECDGQTTQLVPGQSALVAPRRSLRVLWSADCEQLLVRIPNSLMRAAAAGNSQLQRSSRNSRSLVAPLTVMRGIQAKRWNLQVQSILDTVSQDGGADAAHPAWLDYSETGLALYLLTLQASAIDGIGETHARPSGGRNDPMAMAERFARSRLCAPLALEDLAKAAGVSARTLHVHCKREFNVGPIEWLRQLRLDEAREMLQRSGTAHVTEIAMSCGFGHLGRFAAYYRKRFGELPRDTAALM
jgi:AraC-like DNA-binding protein